VGCGNGSRAIHGGDMKQKVVVLKELQRAIVYTRELSKQAIEGHVSKAFIVYSVNKGAKLTFTTNPWLLYQGSISSLYTNPTGIYQRSKCVWLGATIPKNMYKPRTLH
jgi:hypothetical protein